MKTLTIVIGVVVIIVAGSVLFWRAKTMTAPQNPDVGTDTSALIQVSYPLPNQKITSPFIARGKARGNWYFEASFPIFILDENGDKLGSGIAQAQGEWMTTEFVPFEATITFEKPNGKTGTVAFLKDNPSGLPENDDSISIPVSF